MTFDEAIEELEKNVKGKNIPADVVVYFFEKMREEYVPTIEMTHKQARTFASYYHHENPMRKEKFDYPNDLIMKEISEKELTQAWLHPETIKVVDE